jgi:FkbM family methyltransferase
MRYSKRLSGILARAVIKMEAVKFLRRISKNQRPNELICISIKYVKYLLGYIRRFGALAGLQIFLRLNSYILPGHREMTMVRLPFYPSPISVRLSASDVSVFQYVFVDTAFNLDYLNLNPRLIVDGGAYVGFTSVFFAHVYPQAIIFAIEPDEDNYKMLLENTRSYPKIVPVRAALWNKEGKVRIANPGHFSKAGLRVMETAEQKNVIQVDALTLDRLLSAAKMNSIDILKLNIEGAEFELFRSNYESWLEKTNTIVIDLHDRIREGCSEVFYAATFRYNFSRRYQSNLTVLFKKNSAR